MTNLVFAGSPEFAVPSLQAMAAWCQSNGHTLHVMTQPDRPAGRGRQVQASAVKQAALDLGLQMMQPQSLKDTDAQAALAELAPKLMVVAAYGQILPAKVLSMPEAGCINVHASCLPRWRGAAPIHRAIEAGDRYTGVSIMQMSEGLDTGDVWLRRSALIGHNETTAQLHDRLAALGGDALMAALPIILQGVSKPLPQINAYASYANKLHKSEAPLDWQQPAQQLAKKIQAFNPYPVATAQYDDQVLRIWQAMAVNVAGKGEPGELVGEQVGGIDVMTGAGVLRIQTLQRPGGKPMPASEWLRGQTNRAVCFA